MWQSHTFPGTRKTDAEKTNKRSGGLGDRMFEEVGDELSGERREEEDHVEGAQVQRGPSLSQSCED